jgi:Pyruvate/2-oxoacid:ferredoxin oxidoreductase delta subunit/coenzyme F420-reducing hydrogenase delta subunit
MVWDLPGQRVAVEGARLIDLFPMLSEPVSRSFSGVAPPPGSFFFMNLFLHVALPLGLAGLLWLHVGRLARPALLPPRPLRWVVLGALGVVALLLPVPLPAAADLRALPGRVPIDVFYAFWLPLAGRLSPPAHLAVWVGLLGSLFAVPWLWRPRRSPIRPSRVAEDRCTGCTQCYLDCPYEAIEMRQRSEPSALSELVAHVDPTLCVGCGICAGSCAPMGVGPPGRTGRDQLAAVATALESYPPDPRQVVVLGCASGGVVADLEGQEGTLPVATGCAGSIHTSVVEVLLRRGFGGVFLLTCPPRDCLYREGPRWLQARVYEEREAELQPRVDRRRVAIGSFSPAELAAARRAVAALRSQVRALADVPREDAVDLDVTCDVPVPEEVAGVG